MKKLYIPTSTFNFNNILSSESISPMAFYARRCFGYSRWQAVDENPHENVILLYDQPFRFNRPESDLEDHPMLIELTADCDYEPIADGISFCDRTIYLSPHNARFIFFSEQDRKVALSLSVGSAETKLTRLYRKRFDVEPHYEERTLPMPNAVTHVLNEQAIEEDWQLNKMKGLLYGYHIGALLSTTTEIVEHKRKLWELQNIFASVLSAESRRPTNFQAQRISQLLQALRDFGQPSQDVRRVLDSLAYDEQKDNNGIRAIAWLDSELSRVTDSEWRGRRGADTKGITVKRFQCSFAYNKRQDLSKLASKWANEVLSDKHYNGKISTFAEELSDKLTFAAKDMYEAKWQECDVRGQLNLIRRYIRGQEVDVDWHDVLFASVAAVLAKGSDWEKLLNFMQRKGMTNYRLAFAFYGELNGFANLTRDFTDILLGGNDTKFIAELYRSFSIQLLAVDPGDISAKIPASATESSVCKTTGPQTISSAMNEEPRDSNKALRREDILAAVEKIKLNKKQHKALQSTLEALNEPIDCHKLIETLRSQNGWKSGKAIKQLVDRLGVEPKSSSYRPGKQKVSRYCQAADSYGHNLFDCASEQLQIPIHESIIYDANARNIIRQRLEQVQAASALVDQIIAIFDEFQRSYQSGYYYKYPNKYQRNNSDVINHFNKWCLSEKNRRRLDRITANSKMMDDIEMYLKTIYHG